jgi:membrane protein implicated in regulation of membrane protease activity
VSGMPSFLNLNSIEFWAVAGVIFVIIEILSPVGFFLSFAMAAFAVAIKLAIAGDGSLLFALENLGLFLLLSVALILPIRAILRTWINKQKDINDY